MKPYYEDDLVKLFLGDCREEDEWFLESQVLVFDPPYGFDYKTNWASDGLARSIANDVDTSVRDYILDGWNGPALVFGSEKIAKPAYKRMTLIWDKGGALGMGNLSIPWKPGHEEIYVVDRHNSGPWQGSRTNDVLRYPPVQSMAKNGRQHPNQKPVPLMVDLVSKTVGTVGDPTCGVGSTLVAAKRIGRPSIGYELDEAYCEIAAKRLQAEVTLGFAEPTEEQTELDLDHRQTSIEQFYGEGITYRRETSARTSHAWCPPTLAPMATPRNGEGS